MASVIGIGGIFFKSSDPEKLGEWYKRWLNVPVEHPYGASLKPGTMPPGGLTVWSPFKADTQYFAPSASPFMFNLIVDNIEEALAQVSKGGAEIVGDIQKEEYGDFGWFMDPDGNKVELWQPKESDAI